MLEQATLQVLTDLAEVGLPEAIGVALSSYDPFLRRRIRRRVQSALDEAAARAPSEASDHVLRLAFLLAQPRPEPVDPKDIVGVGETYRRLSAPFLGQPAPRAIHYGTSVYRAPSDPRPPPIAPKHMRRKRSWPITTPLVLLLGLTALGIATATVFPHFIPTPEERFRGSALGKSLGEPLTDLVSDEVYPSGEPWGRAKALFATPEVRAQIGAEATETLDRLTRLIPEAVAAPTESVDVAMAPLFDAVNSLNTRLADEEVPALLHAYASGGPNMLRSVWVTSYFVGQRSETTLDGQTLHTAWGRRIDSLNLADTTIYKGDAEDWIVLSLDKVEETFDQTLLAAVARDAPVGPEEYEATDTSPRAELARVAGRLIAAEIVAHSRLTPSDADSVYRALAARNEAIRGLGYAVQPARLSLPPWLVRSMVATKAQNRSEGPLIEEALRMNARMGPYREAVASAASELAFLEEELFVTRLFDEKRFAETRVPQLSEVGLDWPWARVIVASQLGTLARAHDCPRLAFWRVATKAHENGYRGEYYAVTRLVFDMLFKELGIPAIAEGESAELASPSFARAMLAALQAPPERVRAAAALAYRTIFGSPPPSPVRRGFARTSR
jgi:hypothetical protein